MIEPSYQCFDEWVVVLKDSWTEAAIEKHTALNPNLTHGEITELWNDFIVFADINVWVLSKVQFHLANAIFPKRGTF